MTRTLLAVRDACAEDAPFLVELWSESVRRVGYDEQLADLRVVIAECAASPVARLLVAEHDGTPAGAVMLRVATTSAVNPEPVVQVHFPQVVPQRRRKGIGRALMECAVGFAEERGVDQVVTAVGAGSRDANRFMARLALGPAFTARTAPTTAVRARLTASRPLRHPVAGASQGRQVTKVMAARRSMRRSRAAG